MECTFSKGKWLQIEKQKETYVWHWGLGSLKKTQH